MNVALPVHREPCDEGCRWGSWLHRRQQAHGTSGALRESLDPLDSAIIVHVKASVGVTADHLDVTPRNYPVHTR